MNIETNLYELLKNNDKFILSSRLIENYGMELAFIIGILIEREKECIKNNSISSDGYFEMTNYELVVYSGLEFKKVDKVKRMGKKENLILIRKNKFSGAIYYKMNCNNYCDTFIKSSSHIKKL